MRGPVLERYEIVGELGQGGMSVVYRARDKQLGRDVAVKVLHEFLARQSDARKRFHREAVACAKLKHHGILEIFDYSGVDAKDSYIVTELIEGETLRDFIDKRGRPAYPELGVLIVAELVRALRHAHERSVLHRDLKPENVMITKDGMLKLMDFGLAQLMDSGTKLTATGTLLGSPAHMAPEVIDGKPSDARADIFSTGTILYWLCTGRLPFEAPNPSALFKRILDGQYEDPQVLEPKVGNNLARIIHRTLVPAPEQRYQDVTELLADLEEELSSVGFEASDSLVRKYLKDTQGTTQELGPKLVHALAQAGKQALAEGQIARAMDRMNRVLAIDPDHAEVKVLVARVARRQRLAQRVRQLALALSAGAVISGLGFAAWALYPKLTVPEAVSAQPAKLAPALPPAKPPASSTTAVAVQALVPHAETHAPLDAPAKGKAPPSKLQRASEERKPERSEPLEARVEPDTAEPPAPVEFPVGVRIGGGFARRVLIDGASRPTNGWKDTYRLSAGTHQITVENDLGRHQPRTIEVGPSGEVYAVEGGVRRRLMEGIVDFIIPKHPGQVVEGWQAKAQ